MFDRKQLLLIVVVAVVALLFFVLVVISAFLPKQDDSQVAAPTPTAADIVIPTSSQSIPTALPEAEGIQLISIDPPDGTKNAVTNEQIIMSFSSPMNEKHFFYKIEPKTSTYIHTEGEKVIITPETVWKIGTNVITIYDASLSVDGKRLATPFQYTFDVAPLPTPELLME